MTLLYYSFTIVAEYHCLYFNYYEDFFWKLFYTQMATLTDEMSALVAILWSNYGYKGLTILEGELVVFHNSRERLIAISDGVFAVVLTIMVLSVTAPLSRSTPALIQVFKQILIFLISFAVVAQYWMLHQELFSAVKQVSVRLMLVNFYYLGALSLIPFATAWLSHDLFSRVAVLVFATILLVVDFVQYQLFRLVMKSANTDPTAHDLEEFRSTKLMFLISIGYIVIGGCFPKTLLIIVVLGILIRTGVAHWFRSSRQASQK